MVVGNRWIVFVIVIRYKMLSNKSVLKDIEKNIY